MKICMITPRYPPNIHGGGEISCKLLVDSLSDHNVDVDVISADRVFPSIKNKDILNIKMFKYLKNKLNDYDVFHTYNMSLLKSVGALTKKFNIKSLATLNGIVFSPSLSTYFLKYGSPRFYRNIFLVYRYIKYIKRFTTLFQYFKDKWVRDGIPEDRIIVIPNMIDSNFHPTRRTKSNKIRLLYVGNYSRTRSEEIRKLIEIYSLLKKQDIVLYLVGKGKEKVEELIKLYKPKNSLNHLGEKLYTELPKIYANADIFFHPSKFPKVADRVIYEAMMSGVCVITTGNDYYSSIIRDMKNGLLVYPLDVNVFAEKLQILIENTSLRKKLAHNGKSSIYEKCNPETISNQYLTIYNDIMLSD